MKLFLIVTFVMLAFAAASEQKQKKSIKAEVSCTGESHSAKSTAYYPADDPIEGGYYDCMGSPLQTLQQYLDGTVDYVAVAMDSNLEITYGTQLCIPEINDYYGVNIEFRVVDTGPAFTDKGFTRIDICVQDEEHSYEDIVNGQLTLIFPDLQYGSPSCGV